MGIDPKILLSALGNLAQKTNGPAMSGLGALGAVSGIAGLASDNKVGDHLHNFDGPDKTNPKDYVETDDHSRLKGAASGALTGAGLGASIGGGVPGAVIGGLGGGAIGALTAPTVKLHKNLVAKGTSHETDGGDGQWYTVHGRHIFISNKSLKAHNDSMDKQSNNNWMKKHPHGDH